MTLLLIASFPDSLLGFRGKMIDALLTRGLKVHVAAPDLHTDSLIRARLAVKGLHVHNLPMRRTGMNPIYDLQTLLYLFMLMCLIRPDYVVSYTIKPVIYSSLAARLAGVPSIYSMVTGLGYAFLSEGIKGRLINSIAKSLYKISLRGNKKAFFQNPDDLALFNDLGLLKDSSQAVLINGSGVDLEHFATAPFPEHHTFLLIARLLQDKGIYEYIDAARIIKERYPETTFHLVGWHDINPAAVRKDDLNAWIKEGIIAFLGCLDDVRPAIAESSVYVLPSYREGTPRTVLEAMSMGRPIITSDAPGCRETVIDGENGFLVPVKDANALATAMEKFILQPDLVKRMGKRSREIAEEKYDVHKVNAVIMKAMGLM